MSAREVDPADYVIGSDDTADDIDLDAEEVRLLDGRRLTNHLAEELAADAVRAARERNLVPGGKSLTGGQTHSPSMQFRVPEAVKSEMEAIASAKGISVSKLARGVLEEYLATERARR